MRRLRLLQRIGDSPEKQALVKAHCRNNPVDWFNWFAWTYDPRLVGRPDASAYLPFDLWPAQERFVRFLDTNLYGREENVTEKSRDQGASYLAVGLAIHKWLFIPGFKTTFGSNKEKNVDARDNPDSLFEKGRIILRRLPKWMMPEDFSWSHDDLYMRLVNPETGSTITGEAGDNMGRGGRSSWYVVDEAAFVERADKVEAAVSASSDCNSWISSANGMGNLFYRKRMNLPPERVFTMHYRDDPRKDGEWVKKKKASMDPATWASEYEIDYAASVEGTIILGEWVKAAQEIHKLLPKVERKGRGIAGVDVGAGKARSVFIGRFGPIILPPQRRGEPDTNETAFWSLDCAREEGITVINYDAPGVGVGVTSGFNLRPHPDVEVVPVNTGSPPTQRVWEDERTSEDMFGNLKAELWWLARNAFHRTFRMYQWLTTGGKEGQECPVSDVLMIPPDGTLAMQLCILRWFRNEKGKIVIETKVQLATRGIKSPDEADAFVLTFLESDDDGIGSVMIDTETFHRENPWSIGGGEEGSLVG